MTKPTHYIRFVQAVILAAAVPACSVSSSPSPADQNKNAEKQAPQKTEETQTQQTQQTQQTEPANADDGQEHATAESDAGADANLPFSSGPLMPPVFA